MVIPALTTDYPPFLPPGLFLPSCLPSLPLPLVTQDTTYLLAPSWRWCGISACPKYLRPAPLPVCPGHCRNPLPGHTILYNTPHYSIILYFTLQYSTLLYNTLHFSTLLYITLLYPALHYTALQYSILLSYTLHYTTVHYFKLILTPPNYFTQHYTTLHFSTKKLHTKLCNKHFSCTLHTKSSPPLHNALQTSTVKITLL